MQRRTLLRAGVGLAGLAVAGAGASPRERSPAPVAGRVYIPGYWPGRAGFRGVRATASSALANGAAHEGAGTLSLLTRIDARGDVRQAVFPIKGHDVAITPDGKTGFFGRMGYGAERGDAHHLTFDAETLEIIAVGKPPKKGWRGGGHAEFVEGGRLIVTSERAPMRSYSGNPSAHHGRLALRDPQTLAIVDTISCHGVDPHEIRLLADGRHIAVANYGSVAAKGASELGVPRRVVDACVTIVDLSTGKLEDRLASSDAQTEVRHLAAGSGDRLMAIRARLGPVGADQSYLADAASAYEADRSADDGEAYLPAEPILFDRTSVVDRSSVDAATLSAMRHGLSVEYDLAHDEFIATFPSSHRIMIFDAADGALKRSVDTAATGLRYPSGLALLPGGEHYAVAGYWENLFVYERGTHRLLRDLCHYPVLFGHSHMTAA